MYGIETESQNVHDENILHSSLFINASHYIALLTRKQNSFLMSVVVQMLALIFSRKFEYLCQYRNLN